MKFANGLFVTLASAVLMLAHSVHGKSILLALESTSDNIVDDNRQPETTSLLHSGSGEEGSVQPTEKENNDKRHLLMRAKRYAPPAPCKASSVSYYETKWRMERARTTRVSKNATRSSDPS